MPSKQNAGYDSKYLVSAATNSIWNLFLTIRPREDCRDGFSDHCGNNMRAAFVPLMRVSAECECGFGAFNPVVSKRTVEHVCACVRVHVCGSVISSSFESCHRADTIVRRAFHRQISDVPVIQSNYTERNRYCCTLGIDSKQNRKVKIRPHTHLWPCAACSEPHTHAHACALIPCLARTRLDLI